MEEIKHRRLYACLKSLAGHGVPPDRITADELDALVIACRRCENPFKDVNADAIGIPVRVCDGVYMWKLTVGASVWLDEYAEKWWGGSRNANRYFWALVYALVNARKKEAFENLDTERRAFVAILKCVSRIHATVAEIETAVDEALGRPSRPGQNRRKTFIETGTDWSQVAARLESQSGIPASEWLWERSAAYTSKAYSDLRRFAVAYSGGGQECEKMFDELDHALTDLKLLQRRIVDRVRKEDGNG